MISFEGSHNSVKAKCLMLLNSNTEMAFTVRRMARELGLRPGSLAVLVARWTRWGYVERAKAFGSNGFAYHIAREGQQWLARWGDVMPAQRYQEEIAQHRAGTNFNCSA